MIYRKLIILLLSLTCFSFQVETEKDIFKENVKTFLTSFSNNFNASSERYTHSKYNDFILEENIENEWSKTTTIKSKTSFNNHYNQTVYQRLYLGFHEYKNEATCDSAFSALMDCLGNDCAKINWGDENKGIKTTPFIYIKTSFEIVFCKINCEHDNEFWTEFKSKMIEKFSDSNSRIIEAGCGGPLTFKEIK